MHDFWTWLLTEGRQPLIDPAVLRGYETSVKDEHLRLIRREACEWTG
jgi:hypothetical protein